MQEVQKLNSPKVNDPMKKWANELKRVFSKEEVQMPKNHIKQCSTSLAIKEVQIKTMLRFYFIPVQITIIKNTNNNKCWQRYGEKETLTNHWWECKLVQPPWKTVWRSLKKLKLELPYDSAIQLLGMFLKECKSGNNKDTCTPMFIAVLFTTAKLWKQPRCPTTDEC
jgi:hypothetical protein